MSDTDVPDDTGAGPLVGIVMGSDSDWPVMRLAAVALDEFGIPYEVDVVSAHRMPREMIAYGNGRAVLGIDEYSVGQGTERQQMF